MYTPEEFEKLERSISNLFGERSGGMKRVVFDFSEASCGISCYITSRILRTVFREGALWLGVRGQERIPGYFLKRFFRRPPCGDVLRFPYEPGEKEREQCEYEHSYIVFIKVEWKNFAISRFVSHMFEDRFLVNNVVLFHPYQEIAVDFYNRQRVNLVSDDDILLRSLCRGFPEYLSVDSRRAWLTVALKDD